MRKRAQQIRKFYAYVQANRKTQYVQTFSQWVKKNAPVEDKCIQ